MTRWDYRHQLLETRYMAGWRVFAATKLMEVVVHLRPRALWRVLAHPDPGLRRRLRWCLRNSARVWVAEVVEFIWRTKRPTRPVTLAEWLAPRRRLLADATGTSTDTYGAKLSSTAVDP